MRVREYAQTPRTGTLKATWRSASYSVIETTREIKASIGGIPSIDYGRNNEAQGAQYASKEHNIFFVVIDYIADVYSTAKKVLDSKAATRFIHLLEDDVIDLSVVREDDLEMHEALGRAFIGRELYPTSRYFKRFKR